MQDSCYTNLQKQHEGYPILNLNSSQPETKSEASKKDCRKFRSVKRSDFQENFLFIQNIEKYPADAGYGYAFPEWGPGFREKGNDSSEEKF